MTKNTSEIREGLLARRDELNATISSLTMQRGGLVLDAAQGDEKASQEVWRLEKEVAQARRELAAIAEGMVELGRRNAVDAFQTKRDDVTDKFRAALSDTTDAVSAFAKLREAAQIFAAAWKELAERDHSARSACARAHNLDPLKNSSPPPHIEALPLVGNLLWEELGDGFSSYVRITSGIGDSSDFYVELLKSRQQLVIDRLNAARERALVYIGDPEPSLAS